MPNTRYRRGKLYAADMALYSMQMASDNSKEISRLKRNLIRALQEDVTERQRQTLLMYYAQGYNMREIGEPHHQAGGAATAALPALWGGGVSEKYGLGAVALPFEAAVW